jgi:hypothetical protein
MNLMHKQDYQVTEVAGREVAGLQNPGCGEILQLTVSQAEHAVRLGHLQLLPAERRRKKRNG